MEKYLLYIDSQSVLFLGGQEANIDLEYDEDTDMFVVTAECGNWANEYVRLVKEYYPEDDPSETVKEAVDDCNAISGKYFTLREINQKLERYCNPGDWYEFT